MKDAVVLYPSPAIGHLISMVELGKLILAHTPSLSVNILITVAPYKEAGSIASYIDHASATCPSIAFHRFAAITPPPNPTRQSNNESVMFDFLGLNNPAVHEALVSISKGFTIQALVVDFFCASALPVARELDIPAFFFITFGACALASFLYHPVIDQATSKSLKDLDYDLNIPGLPPVPPTDMPTPVLDRTNKSYEYLLDTAIQMPKAAGILVNTFEALEPRALKALRDGHCVLEGVVVPPILCIGPLIAAKEGRESGGGSEDKILKWLDSQPGQSVVFLCFGSLGVFSLQQLSEIATGLEKSGKRFLWVVREPPREEDQNNIISASEPEPDPDLKSLLPDGFLDRTSGRGLVVYKWAPQVEVLRHDAVGGFVTHCGWNSVLEAICSGVPMLAWPLYAEQRLNRIVMVEEMKIALPVEESKDGLVGALEVEKRTRELMDTEKGASIRKQTMEMKEEAKKTLSAGGSSRAPLAQLVESWNQH